MPSDRAAKWFRDMLDAIDLASKWTDEAGGGEAAMRDAKTRSAVERQLLVISEAAIRLDQHDHGLAEQVAPEIDWQGIRGIGNVLRHRYDDLDFEIVARSLEERLEPLRQACSHAIASLEG